MLYQAQKSVRHTAEKTALDCVEESHILGEGIWTLPQKQRAALDSANGEHN